MRIEFKKQKIRASKFLKWCENNGADYFETDDETAVWIIPKRYGESFIALKLRKDGLVFIGIINELCMNFENLSKTSTLFVEEQEWIIQTLTLFKKYKP